MNPLTGRNTEVADSEAHRTESSALTMRRRSVWESTDAGVLLWRSNFFHFIPFFAIPVWITACLLRLVPGHLIWLSYLILWWLKPLFDRLVLHVVSLKFFNSASSNKPKYLLHGLAGTIFRSLAGDLLWRRFSPGRGSRMPIRILERIKRKQYAQRKKILAYGGLNFCFFVSFAGLILEVLLLLGEIVFVLMAAQIIHPSVIDYMRNNMELTEVLIFAAFSLNYIIAESLYVCMGFGLYINSRVEVEGWDLQLLFKKFSEEKSDRQGIKTALIICFIFIGFLFPPQISAEAELAADQAESAHIEYFPPDFGLIPNKPRENLQEILNSDDFGYNKDGWYIKYKYSIEPIEEPDSEFLEMLRNLLGAILRLVIILVIAACIGFVVYWIWRFHKEGKIRRFGRNADGNMYRNPLLSPESPELLFARAEDFFRRGLLKEAWAACLSGCLGSYAEYHFIFFPADTTEYGCLRLVHEARSGGEELFRKLIQNWINLAYGDRIPAAGIFEEAVVFGRSIKNFDSGLPANNAATLPAALPEAGISPEGSREP